MPKLILDEATIDWVMQRVSGFPVHAGPNGDLMDPGIQDLLGDVEETAESPWQPGDNRTRLLMLATEACRDVLSHVPLFDEQRNQSRAVKTLSVAVCSLMDTVTALQKTFSDKASKTTRLGWPVSDQNTFVQAGRRLRKTHLQGPSRLVRNKLGAHLDPEIFDSSNIKVSPRPILEALGDALLILTLSFNHKAHAFSWIRPVARSHDGTKLVVETMFDYPVCVRWVTTPEGAVVDVDKIILAADPRHRLHQDVLATRSAYNYLIERTGTNLPQMWSRPTSEILAEEQAEGPSDLPEEPKQRDATPDGSANREDP